jgi:hypothetical protein
MPRRQSELSTTAAGSLKKNWIELSDNEVRQRQYNAAIAGLIGIAPQDEIEGMIAAQLIAAHNATMECYRHAIIGEQTLEGRRDNLSQANKLSRTCAVLLDALNRYRGKGASRKSRSSTLMCMPAGRRWSAWSRPGGGDRSISEDRPHGGAEGVLRWCDDRCAISGRPQSPWPYSDGRGTASWHRRPNVTPVGAIWHPWDIRDPPALVADRQDTASGHSLRPAVSAELTGWWGRGL